MKAENPLVSIIVRTKDRPKLLKNALRSIAHQTYRPIEVVLVNDGGCDLDIEEIRNIFGDVSLNYIRLEKNTGRAHAGNAGIENAKGTYVGFLDDDDELYPEHIETLVSFLEQSDYKVAYTDIKMVFKDFTGEEEQIIDANETVFSKDFSYKDLLVGNYIPFNSLCFSKEILNSAGWLDEGLDLYEDWDFLIRIGQKYPFYHIKKVTAMYNQWSRGLQINQADAEYMKAMHLKIIGKHREKITPEIILEMKHEKENVRFELNKLLKTSEERDLHISRLKETINEKDNYISQLEGSVREKDVQIMNLESTLSLMMNTLGWQMLEGLRRLREKLFTSGTKRRRAFDLAIKSIKTIKNEGWKYFFKKVKAKTKLQSLGPRISQSILKTEGIQHFISPRKFRVLFMISPWAGVTNRYRAYNMKEYLEMSGIESDVIGIDELDAKLPWALGFDILVIHRIPMNDILNALIKKCKELHIPVIFDLDDYIFDVSLVNRIDEIRRMNSVDRNEWIEHVQACRKTLEESDYFIGTTDYLVKKVEELDKKTFVIRNSLNKTQIAESQKALIQVKRDPKVLKIGYFSGTKTHQKDFKIVSPVLIEILSEYENVHLCIGGFLELEEKFNEFSHKIEKLPYVDWKEFPFNIAQVDINIVPLEADNPFCDAKSELKYFETALLKIPTIATPTDAYKWAIRNGENGLLASTEREWYLCIKSLIENPSLRKTIGGKAYEMVMKTYTPSQQAEVVKKVYKEIIMDYRAEKGVTHQRLSLSFIFSAVKNGGNKSKILYFAHNLGERGHKVRIYINTNVKEGISVIEEIYKTFGKTFLQYSESRFEIIHSTNDILSCDALIAVEKESIPLAFQNMDKCYKLFYIGDEEKSLDEEQFIHLKIPKNNSESQILETFLKDELLTV